MATIKTSCPFCGDVDLHSSEVLLTVCSFRPWSYYSFACPKCREAIDKPANEQVVVMLTTGGVNTTQWHVPAEVFEPRPTTAMTHDDLLDFHAALERLDALSDDAL